ncbi:hypothetical protein Ahy_B01g055309 isoform B [Arachis hypogaea]|uniref:Uncharacterized protein n=1 Tax=Arachis hypogaea TaxID=3818 RepID=A0A445AVU0_ARAHY|nr:hypothetical protein Ahy_B01g055309 isoform B [Arachis hypogaea]
MFLKSLAGVFFLLILEVHIACFWKSLIDYLPKKPPQAVIEKIQIQFSLTTWIVLRNRIAEDTTTQCRGFS